MTTASVNATKTVAPLSVPVLSTDLDAGLRRLKLAAIRCRRHAVRGDHQHRTVQRLGFDISVGCGQCAECVRPRSLVLACSGHHSDDDAWPSKKIS